MQECQDQAGNQLQLTPHASGPTWSRRWSTIQGAPPWACKDLTWQRCREPWSSLEWPGERWHRSKKRREWTGARKCWMTSSHTEGGESSLRMKNTSGSNRAVNRQNSWYLTSDKVDIVFLTTSSTSSIPSTQPTWWCWSSSAATLTSACLRSSTKAAKWGPRSIRSVKNAHVIPWVEATYPEGDYIF